MISLFQIFVFLCRSSALKQNKTYCSYCVAVDHGFMQWSQTIFVLLEPLNLAYLVGKTPWCAKEDEKRGSWTLWEKGIHYIVNEHMMCRRNHWTLTIITSSTCARGMWLCDEFSCVCMLTISGCKTLSFPAFLGGFFLPCCGLKSLLMSSSCDCFVLDFTLKESVHKVLAFWIAQCSSIKQCGVLASHVSSFCSSSRPAIVSIALWAILWL